MFANTFGPNGVFSYIDWWKPEDKDLPSFLTKGIETDLQAIDEYLLDLFLKIKEDKDTFLDALSTPLNRDPFEILCHLQNNEFEGDVDMPFQQSVLNVEIYLANEKDRRFWKMSSEQREFEWEKKI